MKVEIVPTIKLWHTYYIGTYAADGDKIWTVCSLLCVNLYEASQMLGMSRVRMSIAPIEMDHILWIWELSLMKNETLNYVISVCVITGKYGRTYNNWRKSFDIYY